MAASDEDGFKRQSVEGVVDVVHRAIDLINVL